MFYTITLVFQDQQAGHFMERVYLLNSGVKEENAESESRVTAELLTLLDLSDLSTVGEADVRPLLFGDFDGPVFAKHFADAQAYAKLWENWLPDSTGGTSGATAYAGLLVFQSAYAGHEPHLYCEELSVITGDFSSVEEEYRKRQEQGEFSYLAGDPPREMQVSLYSASPLWRVGLEEGQPTLLLNRRFRSLELYQQATTVADT